MKTLINAGLSALLLCGCATNSWNTRDLAGYGDLKINIISLGPTGTVRVAGDRYSAKLGPEQKVVYVDAFDPGRGKNPLPIELITDEEPPRTLSLNVPPTRNNFPRELGEGPDEVTYYIDSQLIARSKWGPL